MQQYIWQVSSLPIWFTALFCLGQTAVIARSPVTQSHRRILKVLDFCTATTLSFIFFLIGMWMCRL